MVKQIIFFTFVGILAIGAAWFTDSDGLVTLEWLGFEFSSSMTIFLSVILGCLLLFSLIVAVPFNIIKTIVMLPKKFKNKKSESKKEKEIREEIKQETTEELVEVITERVEGEKEELKEELGGVIDAFTAITMGDMDKAIELQENLQKSDKDNDKVNILGLDIAITKKDKEKIKEYSDKLIANKETELIGLKGLLELGLLNKDYDAATEAVDRAYDIRNDLEWVIRNGMVLRARQRRWNDALNALEIGLNKKLSSSEARGLRLKATMLYELSQEAERSGNRKMAMKLCAQASDLDHSLVAAAVKLSEYYIEDGNQVRKAAGVLSRLWMKRPIAEICDAYVKLWPEDNKYISVQRVEQLCISNNNHILNKKVLAKYAMDAGIYGKARKELDDYLACAPLTKSTAKLMAIFEEKANSDMRAANRWLLDAEMADDDQRWICSKCAHHAEKWESICPGCGDFATLEWVTPGRNINDEIVFEEQVKEKLKEHGRKKKNEDSEEVVEAIETAS